MSRRFAVMMICLAVYSCTPQYSSGPDVNADFEFIDEPTSALSKSGRELMNGVYEVVQGTDVLGGWVTGMWIEQQGSLRWLFFSQDDVYFSECAGGSSGDSIKLTGYVRQVRSGSAIGVRLKILSQEGAQGIISSVPPSKITVRGTLSGGENIELKRSANLSADTTFRILAHQGGGRNSDRLGYSENSIPMIEHAAIFGADGIELDVRLTRDKHVIVFHDETFSARTVQGSYLLGPVKNFDLPQIQSLGRLLNGEPIPTLEEALNTVIKKTNLTIVWVDVKEPEALDQVMEVRQKALLTASSFGRGSLRIFLGLPFDTDNEEDNPVLMAYLRSNNPLKNSTEFLIESAKRFDRALNDPNCKAWAPYWAEELPEAAIARMHSRGKLVFVWTVDLRDIMLGYLSGARGSVDGILTNYSSLARALHDSRR